MLVERAEDVPRDRSVIVRRRACEAVVRDPEVAEVLSDELVVPLGDLTRRDAFSIRRDHHRRTVLVGPAHHQHVVPLQAVVARVDVRGNREPDHVAQVAFPRRIRPGGRHQDLALLLLL